MSVWQSSHATPHLYGQHGELVSISVHVRPRDLESVLEALASVEFPINPQIIHSDGHSDTTVRFPAYSQELPEVYRALAKFGFGQDHVRVASALEPLAGVV
jgi:hypothetical protein